MEQQQMMHDENLESLTSPLARPEEVNPEDYPNLCNVSAGLGLWRFILVPRQAPPPPEYVHVTVSSGVSLKEEDARNAMMKWGWITQWNMAWEAGPMRLGMFNEDEVPPDLRWLGDHEDNDIRLVPEGKVHPYGAYSPLFHLLPIATLRRFGLAPLKRGLWPTTMSSWAMAERVLPPDFRERLSRAVAYHLWPYLNDERPSSFSSSEPITVLANNLDHWLPYIDIVAQERMKVLGRAAADDEERALLDKINAENDPRFTAERPLFGGDVWRGEEEAQDVTKDLIEHADELGRLRSIIDAVKSHRIEDDFSDRWSWAKEDFERKLHKKRSKVKVVFVELDDTIPVHGPDAEVHTNRVWQDLLSVCDRRERRVVVCLRSGSTKVGDIAKELGYANHSPVSKTLAGIRRKASQLLGE